MSLIIVGTDTEVGKTVASAVVLARYGKRRPLAYWKPIATGADEGDTDARRVDRWVGHIAEVLPETYLFEPPVSPHLAAKLARRRIVPEKVLEDLVVHGMADADRALVVEGVGGVLVPVTEGGYLLAQLVAELTLPCLIVARSAVGTINHTLLTLEALRARDVPIAGVVLSGERNKDNRRAIEKFGRVEVVGEIDHMPRVGRKSIEAAARSFDRRGRLKEYFE